MVLVTISLEHLGVFDTLCPWMGDTDVAIALFNRVRGREIWHESAICFNHQLCHQDDLTRGLMDHLQDGGCTFRGFELFSVRAVVGQGGKRHEGRSTSAQGPCGHPKSPNRVLEEWGPCSNLCIFPQCSCVQDTLQPFLHHPETGGTSLHACTSWAFSSHPCETHPSKVAQRSEQRVPAWMGNGTGAKSPTKVTCSLPRTKDVSTALGIHSPYEIHRLCSPGRLCSLRQPRQPSSFPAGAIQNPKIAPQTNVARYGGQLVDSQPTAGGVFIF